MILSAKDSLRVFTSEGLRISGDGIGRIPLPNLSQSIDKGSKITIVRKYLLAVVSPRHHMVEQPTCMYAGIAWHASQMAKLIDLGNSVP
jgi:hypothetical protein